MKHLLKLTVILVLMFAMSLGLYSNGLNLNSNGSKATAMGGAFIGLADDYSAVFWNPAGLTQMKGANFAIFGENIFPSGTYTLDLLGVDAKTEKKLYPVGGIGFFKPTSGNVVWGIYAYVPSGLGAKYNGADLMALSGGASFEWESFLGILTVSPAIAVKVSDKFSMGAALNFNYGLMKMKRPTDLGQSEMDLNGLAFGATIGILFNPSDKLGIGFTFKTPFKAKLKGQMEIAGAGILGLPTTDDTEMEVTIPMWFGGGIAIKPNDNLTFTFDVQYTNWKKLDVVPVTFTNAGWKAFLEAGSQFELEWKDAVQIRFGLEYKVSESFALRGGYYYDPGPGPESTQSILLPELTYNWITCGFGYSTQKIKLDISLEYGIGKDMEVGLGEGLFPGIHGMKMFVPSIALTINL